MTVVTDTRHYRRAWFSKENRDQMACHKKLTVHVDGTDGVEWKRKRCGALFDLKSDEQTRRDIFAGFQEVRYRLLCA